MNCELCATWRWALAQIKIDGIAIRVCEDCRGNISARKVLARPSYIPLVFFLVGNAVFACIASAIVLHGLK